MVSLAVLVERLRHVARGLGPPRFGQPSPVYNLHHLGNRNIGDRQCVPLHDFRHLATNRMRVVDMSLTDPLVASLHDELVVLGGGGLLNPWCWHEVILPLLERNNKVIGWGIGHHHDNVPAHHYSKVPASDWQSSIAHYQQSYPVEKLWMCGLRDHGQPVEYVPCSSCMSPLFDRTYPVTHEVVIYEHGALEPIAVTGVPTISNVGETSFAEVLAFLASGRYILTNSYHGAYWGILLGRRVLLYEPWCSKFRMLKFPLPACDRWNWNERLGQSSAYPGALAECRELNRRFAEKVFANLDDEIRRRRSER